MAGSVSMITLGVLSLVAATSLPITIPLGLDLYMPVPETNPLTVEKIDRGRALFRDRRLSRDGTIACVTCHDPDHGFAGRTRVAIGVAGTAGRRNAPTLINRGYGRAFFWDGRVTSLEEQVLRPIADPNEMGLPVAAAAARVGLTERDLADALASYVRSILAGDSPYDRFVRGDRTALSPLAQAGLAVFRRSNCMACHLPPTFSDERFHNTGVAWTGDHFDDDGRFMVTGQASDRGAFKTPTLREAVRTGPYMHDGSLSTLVEVIDFYDRGGRPNPQLDREIRPLHLADEDKRALLAFLESLSGVLLEGATRVDTR